MPPAPSNPYVVGPALRTRGFWGRDDVFRFVQSVLSQASQNAVVLSGQRRIGKTSILRNLQERLPNKQFVCIYFDLMNRARKPLAEVFFELAATMADELEFEALPREAFDQKGSAFVKHFLPRFFAECGVRRPVLLLDEFDVLDVFVEEQLPEESAARAFFPFLRELMTSEPRLAFVFVIGRKTGELSIEAKSTFKTAQTQRISVLNEADARHLIETAERDGTLHFESGVVDRIVALTACHPFFVQLLCQLLFERAYATQSASKPSVSLADVEAIVPKALEAGENIFEWIWDGLPPAERVVFSAIAQGTDERSVVSEDRLLGILQNSGVRILVRELELAPRTLIDWEMLRGVDGGYRFFVELLRRWVLTRKPLAQVKDELDRINPLADVLFQAAGAFYHAGRLDDAHGQLKQALRANANHLKARLMLGEIYGRQGKLDDSVRELAEAYRIDPDGARYAFESALFARAEQHQRDDAVDKAIADHEQVLTLSPQHRAARERLDELQAFVRDRRRGMLSEQARVAESESRWQDALNVYTELQTLAPDEPATRSGYARASREADLQAKYGEGVAAINTQQWEAATTALRGVVAENPGYRNAQHLLANATAALERERRRGPQGNRQPSRRNLLIGAGVGALALSALAFVAIVRPATPTQNGGNGIAGAVIPGWQAAFSPDGKTLAVGLSNGGVQFWDVQSGKFVEGFAEVGPAGAYSPDGAKLAYQVGSHVEVRDLASQVTSARLSEHARLITAIAWSGDGSLIAVGSADGVIRISSSGDGALKAVIFDAHTVAIDQLAFRGSDSELALLSAAGDDVAVWNPQSGELIQRVPVDSPTLAVSPNGRWVALGGSGGIKIKNADTWEFHEQSEQAGVFEYYIFRVAFSADGSMLAGGYAEGQGQGGTVVLWRFSDNGDLTFVRSIDLGDGNMVDLSFSPDGKLLAAAGYAGKIRVIDIEALK